MENVFVDGAAGMEHLGANSYGQLGLGHCEDKYIPEKVSDVPGKVKSIHGGGGHTVLLTESGDVYSSGWNSRGQLGVKHTDNVSVFHHVDGLPAVKEISCGWDFTLAVTENNSLYAWGSNVYGQLGIPEIQKYSCVPQEVKALQGIAVDVAAGLRHSVAVASDGSVWTWGSGKKGQLGTTCGSGTGYPDRQLLPEKVPLVNNIISVAAGSYHTVCLTGDGELYTWGSNKYQQLSDNCTSGISKTLASTKEDILTAPMKVKSDLFHGQRLQQVHCGWTHAIVITENGQVYSWGRSDYGQLGIGSQVCHGVELKKCTGKPKEILTLRGIVKQLVCGAEHNLVLTGDGSVLAWGWNEHGMCGDGSEVNVMEPKVIEGLSKERIAQIGSGAGHCFALCENG